MEAAGFFINLDKSVKRRRAMEAELRKVGLARTYRRFRAVDGRTLNMRGLGVSRGEAGCFLSHIGVLEAGRKAGRHFHVLEDDAVLSRGFAAHVNALVNGPLNAFDIVFTDMWVPLHDAFIGQLLSLHEAYLTAGAFNVLIGQYWAGSASYLVNSAAVDRLIDLLRQEAGSGMTLPLDLFLGKLAASGAVKVGCLFPFVSSIRISALLDSTIVRPGDPVAERVIADSPRAAFYVEADLKRIRADLDAVVVADIRQSMDQMAATRLLDRMLARSGSDHSAIR